MKTIYESSFRLENFEGPLSFLLQLIQKHEIDIYEVPIQSILRQFLEKKQAESSGIEEGAEFIGSTALLLLQKSQMLLPKHEETAIEQIEEDDPKFEIIHHLLDYCRFKEAAKTLSVLEEMQGGALPRGIDTPEYKTPLGIEHLSLHDLAGLFQQVVAKNEGRRGLIEQETWTVQDKISLILNLLAQIKKIQFSALFDTSFSLDELIVTFLAVLELMKLGKLAIVKESETVVLIGKSHE